MCLDVRGRAAEFRSAQIELPQENTSQPREHVSDKLPADVPEGLHTSRKLGEPSRYGCDKSSPCNILKVLPLEDDHCCRNQGKPTDVHQYLHPNAYTHVRVRGLLPSMPLQIYQGTGQPAQ